MALVTLLLLLLFAALVLRPTLSHPPAWLVRLTDEAAARIDPLAMWVLVYSLAAIFLTAFFVPNTLDIFVRLFANVVLLLLALPAGAQQLDRAFSKDGARSRNEAIAESLGDIVQGIARYQTTIAYVGLAAAVLLFAVMFR